MIDSSLPDLPEPPRPHLSPPVDCRGRAPERSADRLARWIDAVREAHRSGVPF